MKRPVIQIFFAAMLGLAVLFTPGSNPSAQAAPVAPSSLTTPAVESSLIHKAWYVYYRPWRWHRYHWRRHYWHRYYWHRHYWHRHYWHRRYYW